MNVTFIPSLCAFVSAFLATFVIIEFCVYVSQRYHERYLKEASTGLDDVLIQMPASRIFDFGLALGVGGLLVTTTLLKITVADLPFKWCFAIGLLPGVLLFVTPLLMLRFLRSRRLARFNVQLEDALGMIANSLKAGLSINQALEEVAELELKPVSIEFRLLVQELRLGVPLEQALENMNQRLKSDDFMLVSTAILTARQTGGELTVTLERVAGLVRERVRIASRVSALTAMGRLQAIIIGLMPFFLLFGILYVNPQMGAFFRTSLGIVVLVVVVILDIIGFLWIRKIVSIEV